MLAAAGQTDARSSSYKREADGLARQAAKETPVSWDAIGAIAESLGAIGVIFSLVYLGVQIRQNTRSVRRASARQTSDKNAVALRCLADYSELFSGDLFGFDRLANLEPSERARFDMIWGMWMQATEQTLADVREGVQEPEYAVPYRDLLRDLFSSPGGQQWWSERRAWFSASFQREVDQLIAGH